VYSYQGLKQKKVKRNSVGKIPIAIGI